MRLHILETFQQPTQHPARAGNRRSVDALPGRVFETQEPFVVPDVEPENSFPQLMEMLRGEEVRSFCVVPLTTAQRRLGTHGVWQA